MERWDGFGVGFELQLTGQAMDCKEAFWLGGGEVGEHK